ncbi:hypothetical protein FGO68_gene15976 [Halteria grandinella]|uniref:Uncharacterized protein n=1 Tax=Halteria grandinella TaxID=5974 RepID=A0A8J8SXG1_HALGN|nr:hypothetical protein FGO68_gene15976 [Halteria grandinella]
MEPSCTTVIRAQSSGIRLCWLINEIIYHRYCYLRLIMKEDLNVFISYILYCLSQYLQVRCLTFRCVNLHVSSRVPSYPILWPSDQFFRKRYIEVHRIWLLAQLIIYLFEEVFQRHFPFVNKFLMLIVIYLAIISCRSRYVFKHIIPYAQDVLDERVLILETHSFKNGMRSAGSEDQLDQVGKLPSADQLQEALKLLFIPQEASQVLPEVLEHLKTGVGWLHPPN